MKPTNIFFYFLFFIFISKSDFVFASIKNYTPQFTVLTNFITNSGTGTVQIKIELDPAYTAYADKFKLSASPWLSFTKAKIKPTYLLKDTFSKQKKLLVKTQATLSFVYENLKDWKKDIAQIPLYLDYQICTKTVCYLKQTKKLYIHTKYLDNIKLDPLSAANDCKKHFFSLTCLFTINQNILLTKLQNILISKNYLFLIFILFIAGLLMSFTPCVLPMIPITLSIIGAQQNKTLKAKLLVSAVYSLGISLTYASMGLVAALTGSLFGNILASPYVQFIFAFIFLLSAFSLFGLFSINTPLNTFQKYNIVKKSGLLGVFSSGLFAGLIASPCIGPVLLGVLSFVAQSQNATLGFVLLFVLAQGLNFSLMIISLTGGLWIKKYLQKPQLMYGAKIILGVGFLLGAVYFSYPLLSAAKQLNTNRQNGHKMWTKYTDVSFKNALKLNKPIVLDFYADWCISCLELDIKIFGSKAIQNKKLEFTWLQIDFTRKSDTNTALGAKYKVLGLPTILFFSKSGVLQKDLRLTGFENSKKFQQRLNKLLKRQ